MSRQWQSLRAAFRDRCMTMSSLPAMRSLFKLGEKEDDDIDTPLLLHGGAPAMDQDA